MFLALQLVLFHNRSNFLVPVLPHMSPLPIIQTEYHLHILNLPPVYYQSRSQKKVNSIPTSIPPNYDLRHVLHMSH